MPLANSNIYTKNPSKTLFVQCFYIFSVKNAVIYTLFGIKSVQNTGFCSVFNALASKNNSKYRYLQCFFWRPSGVPWPLRLCASIWRGRCRTCCKGRDVRPGVPLASLWRPSGVPLASLWRPSGVPLASLWRPSGVPLASLWRPSGVPLASLWRPSGVPLASLWRPSGVPWPPRLCASIWRGRRGTCCSARGVMYALASLWRHSL